ncbi:MAG: hypothetical protein AB8F95_00920 [Bacteroidia bacterium]
MMSNNHLAKKVIATILDQKVLSLELNQQEFVRQGAVRGFKVFRLDLKATIQHTDGRKEQVMIELQKSKLPTNVHRFRQYLGGLYGDNSRGSTPELADQQSTQLPIITIYILGYNIPDLPVLATRVERRLVDASTGKEVTHPSTFVQALVHQSHIIQIRRLPEKRRTRLEHFLQLFDQSCVTNMNYILEVDEIPSEFNDIASYLSKPLKDKAMIDNFTVEEEMEMYFRITDAEKAAAASRLEELEMEKQKAISKFAKMMLKLNYSQEEILAETGISENALLKLQSRQKDE